MTIPMPYEKINYIRPLYDSDLITILNLKNLHNHLHPGSARHPLLTVWQCKDSQTITGETMSLTEILQSMLQTFSAKTIYCWLNSVFIVYLQCTVHSPHTSCSWPVELKGPLHHIHAVLDWKHQIESGQKEANEMNDSVPLILRSYAKHNAYNNSFTCRMASNILLIITYSRMVFWLILSVT